jgi:hypothetical protein
LVLAGFRLGAILGVVVGLVVGIILVTLAEEDFWRSSKGPSYSVDAAIFIVVVMPTFTGMYSALIGACIGLVYCGLRPVLMALFCDPARYEREYGNSKCNPGSGARKETDEHFFDR